jgi:hypothetical protein
MEMKKLLIALLLAAAPAYATLTDTTNGRRIATGDGLTLVYVFTFPAVNTGDLAISVVLNGTPQVISYGVALNADQIASPGGTVTFSSAPPNLSVVTIQRNEALTQQTSLPAFFPFPNKTVERSLDSIMRKVQQIDRDRADLAAKEVADITATIAGGLGATNLLAPTGTGETTPITLAARFAQIRVPQGMGAVANNSSDDSTAINNTIALGKGIVYLPPSTSCYYTGTTTINLAHNVQLVGAGRGSGGTQGPSCIRYTGTGCAIKLNSTQSAAVKNIDVRVDSASATARGICLYDTANTVNAQFNTIEGNSVFQVNATRRVAGQIGIHLQVTSGMGIYWNTVRNNRLAYWDTAVRLQGCTACAAGQPNGANENDVEDTMSWGHVTAMSVDTNSVDNMIRGLKCSRSDDTFVGTNTCLLLGDNTNNSGGNYVFGMVSDQGSPSVCGTIGSQVSGSVVFANCESGLFTDNSTTSIQNLTYVNVSGPTIGRFSVPTLKVTKGIDVSATGSPWRFATYTSCTTAAAIGAACTSGPAGISPAYTDTNYRISCTMNAVTGQPHVVGVTKTSGSAFTLTIAADTAVAAGGTFDCLLMHL